jgi:hypothetical protein
MGLGSSPQLPAIHEVSGRAILVTSRTRFRVHEVRMAGTILDCEFVALAEVRIYTESLVRRRRRRDVRDESCLAGHRRR